MVELNMWQRTCGSRHFSPIKHTPGSSAVRRSFRYPAEPGTDIWKHAGGFRLHERLDIIARLLILDPDVAAGLAAADNDIARSADRHHKFWRSGVDAVLAIRSLAWPSFPTERTKAKKIANAPIALINPAHPRDLVRENRVALGIVESLDVLAVFEFAFPDFREVFTLAFEIFLIARDALRRVAVSVL